MVLDDDMRSRNEENRLSWNEATIAHNSHKGDQAAWFRDGGSTLYPEDLDILGDVRGKRILHLQCNSGQDSLSIARLGAQVTGVDISDEAIAFARKLSEDTGIPGTFVRADVYDWLEKAATSGEQFDVVFCSYGALVWLGDLGAWARGVASVLAPGGHFACIEFHPFMNVFELDWSFSYDYFSGTPVRWGDGVGDYVAASGEALARGGYEQGIVDFKNPHPVNEYQFAPSEAIGALLRAGLVLESFDEYPFANGWKARNGMREAGNGRFIQPEGMPVLPMMFSVTARKPGS